MFPDDITDPPWEYEERFFDVRQFTKMPTGEHFAALEVPDLVAEDIGTFVSQLSVAQYPSS